MALYSAASRWSAVSAHQPLNTGRLTFRADGVRVDYYSSTERLIGGARVGNKRKGRVSNAKRAADKNADARRQNNVTAEWVQKSLLGFVGDSLFFHRASMREVQGILGCRYARQAIVLASLAVECAANCVLAATKMAATLRKDIEKMASLSKLDACLHLRGCQLDRGRIEVQKAAELISARNDFVHPKIHSWSMEFHSLVNEADRVLLNMGGEIAYYPALNIPRRADLWRSDHSLLAIQALLDFIAYIFDLLSIEDTELQEIFCSFVWIGGKRLARLHGEPEDELSREEPGLNVSLLYRILKD